MARKHSKKGTEKHLNLQCKQCSREQAPKVGVMEERVSVGVYRNASTAARVKQERIVLERDSGGPRPEARKGKGQEKGGKGDIRVCWSCGEPGHIAANCVKERWNRSLNAVEEDKGDISPEVREGGDGLCAWCLLEESENEQWQEVASKKSKLKSREVAHESLLSVENKSCASPKKVIEVKDNWVNIRATVDTKAARHSMPAEMFLRVKLDRTTATEIRCSKWRRNIEDLGEKTIPFKSVEGLHRSKRFRSASVVRPLISRRKVVQAGNVVVLVEKNPHIGNNRDGTVIKLDVNNGVHTMHVGASMKLVRLSAGKDSEWLECHKQTCKTRDEVQQ